MSKAKKVLLVEDDIDLGDLFVEVLTKRGYEVTWYVRARLADNKLVFMTDRGVEVDFDAEQNSRDYDIALVDWRLKMSSMQGVDVTRALCERGLFVVASSGMPSFNQDLIEAGAKGSIVKHDLYGLKRDVEDPLGDMIKPAK